MPIDDGNVVDLCVSCLQASDGGFDASFTSGQVGEALARLMTFGPDVNEYEAKLTADLATICDVETMEHEMHAIAKVTENLDPQMSALLRSRAERMVENQLLANHLGLSTLGEVQTEAAYAAACGAESLAADAPAGSEGLPNDNPDTSDTGGFEINPTWHAEWATGAGRSS